MGQIINVWEGRLASLSPPRWVRLTTSADRAYISQGPSDEKTGVFIVTDVPSNVTYTLATGPTQNGPWTVEDAAYQVNPFALNPATSVAPAAGESIAAALSSAHRIPLKRPGRLLNPEGIKFAGGNIVLKATDQSQATGHQWESFWNNWDWANWVKLQVDNLVAIRGNTVRVIGDARGVLAGTFSQATYLARWTQLLDYCKANGVYVYACGGDYTELSGSAYVLSDAQPILVALAALLETYPNVIAFDVWQEASNTGAFTSGVAATTAAAIRAVTTIPITFSHLGINNSGGWSDAAWIALLGTSVDFHDWHVYYTPALADMNGYWASTSLPLMIGETGTNVNQGAPARLAHIQAIRDFIGGRPDVMGVCYWAITDQDTVTTNQWGLFDSSFVARTPLTDTFRQWPKDFSPWYVKLIPTSDLTWGSVGSFVSAPGFPVTIQLGVPCRVHAHFVADLTVPTADLIAGRHFVDGANPEGVDRFVIVGNPSSTAPYHVTAYQQFLYFVTAASHTFDLLGSIVQGSTFTGAILGGQHSSLLLGFEGR